MLTVEQLREHVTTDLGDEALERLLDAAYEALDAYAGITGEITELISPGPGDLLMLARSTSEVESVVECDLELDADDTSLIGGQMLRRLDTGTNPSSRWRGRVVVTYTPSADAAERDRVAIELVKLDVDSSPGVVSERVGDHSITYAQGDAAYATQRAEILRSFALGFMAA